MTRGARIRALRKALGLTQAALAARSGALDQSYINKIEAGRNQASTHNVRSALARAFDLSQDDLSSYLEGSLALKATMARMRRETTHSASPGTPALIESAMVPVSIDAGTVEIVPLSELIRAYQLVVRLGGFDTVEGTGRRVSKLEASVTATEERLAASEERLAVIDKLIEQGNLEPRGGRGAPGKGR